MDWAREDENELNEFISNQKIMKFQINNFKMSRREASRHFEIIYEKFHNFWCEINSFNSFSSSRAQSISKKSNFNFRVLLDERMDLTYPNIGVLAFLTNFWLFSFTKIKPLCLLSKQISQFFHFLFERCSEQTYFLLYKK